MGKCHFFVAIFSMITLLGCNSNSKVKPNELDYVGNVSYKPEEATSRSKSHIEFLEIPIEGDVDAFGNKLSAKGYKFFCEETAMPALVYKGNYLNKDVSIMLDFEKETRMIKSARALFKGDIPNAESLIKEYTEKYGKCEMKVGYSVEYIWKVNGGKIVVASFDSSLLSIGYYNYWKK